MMPRPIGYYVHHQGAGHLHRARLMAGRLKRRCTVIGTFTEDPGQDFLSLPDDRLDAGFEGRDGEAGRPVSMHYAPLGHAGVRRRMAAIAAWIAANDPVLLVVDVSVEVALFARLLSVPVVMVRLAGRRDDQPHLEAFRSAEVLLAPFPRAFECDAMPSWVKAKTVHVGFLTRQASDLHPAPVSREIAVILGRGGALVDDIRFIEAAGATPEWTWNVYGSLDRTEQTVPSNLRLHGWTNDVAEPLGRAEVVIGACGDGLLAAVAAGGKRFICVPEERPYDEQVAKARVLASLGLALVTGWPDARRWPDLLRRAMEIDGARLGAFHDPGAVELAVEAIDALANRLDP